MRHARVIALAGLAIAATAVAAYAAQTTVVPVPDNEPVQEQPLEIDLANTHWGDAEAGATAATTCAACHGADGNSIDPMYPRLAGQSERYIARQLALFASGERHTGLAAVMVPFAQSLTPQQMRDVGPYYAGQKAGAGVADDTEVASGRYAGMKFYEVGQQLYRNGDAERGIPACLACHGPSGAGNPGPAYPHVAGQVSGYTAGSLDEYRSVGTSERDPAMFNIMAKVASKLTDEEIGGLASYLQGLHARADDVAATEAAGRQ